MPIRLALEVATVGGAQVLGRDDIGALAPGKTADFAAFDLNHIEYTGAQHDPVAALLLCAPTRAAYTFVHGSPVVSEGRPVNVELETLVEEHNRAARATARLADSEPRTADSKKGTSVRLAVRCQLSTVS